MTRTEHDLLGAKEIPADALYGVHTARARENFSLTGRPVHPELARAYGTVKLACARTNRSLGAWSDDGRSGAKRRICSCRGRRKAIHGVGAARRFVLPTGVFRMGIARTPRSIYAVYRSTKQRPGQILRFARQTALVEHTQGTRKAQDDRRCRKDENVITPDERMRRRRIRPTILVGN